MQGHNRPGDACVQVLFCFALSYSADLNFLYLSSTLYYSLFEWRLKIENPYHAPGVLTHQI